MQNGAPRASARERARLAPPPSMESYALGDWVTVTGLYALGLYLDKQPPFERYIGTQLDDMRIAYPHTPAQQQRVTADQLWVVALVGPLLGLFCLQALRPNGRKLNRAALGLISSLAVTLVLVCIVKNCVGRLRPDFLARCKPLHGVCTGNAAIIVEGRKSFPSGHTALSFAGLTPLALHINADLLEQLPAVPPLFRMSVSMMPLVLALVIGLSRIADYWYAQYKFSNIVV